MKANRLTAILAAAVVVLTTGCKREPLYDIENNLVVDINIDYNIKYTPVVTPPTLMFVGFYDNVTGALRRTEFTPAVGGPAYVSAGLYDVMVYNYDTDVTEIRANNNIRTAEAFTSLAPSRVRTDYMAMVRRLQQKRGTSSRADDYGQQDIINEPDHLFTGCDWSERIPVRDTESELYEVHVDASTLVETYQMTIGPIKGMEYIELADVFITGQAPSKLIATREITGSPATIYHPLTALSGARSNQLQFTFTTFGKFPGADNEVILVVKIVDETGNATVLEADVTDQFDDPNNTDNEIIIDQPIEIEPPAEGIEGGFRPRVDRWDDIVTDIII